MQLHKHYYEQLRGHYTEPHRSYHALPHIDDLLSKVEWLSKAEELTKDEEEKLKVAIVFHDAIYIPCAFDNEKRSAELYKSLAVDDFSFDVYEAIVDTSTHLPNTSNRVSVALSDLDMSPLGHLDYSVFVKDGENIKKEFVDGGYTTEGKWFKGRAEFLRKILSAERIFFTQSCFREYEQRARENILKNLKEML